MFIIVLLGVLAGFAVIYLVYTLIIQDDVSKELKSMGKMSEKDFSDESIFAISVPIETVKPRKVNLSSRCSCLIKSIKDNL